MNISLNWLKEYLKIDLSVEKVCEILTSIGSKWADMKNSNLSGVV